MSTFEDRLAALERTSVTRTEFTKSIDDLTRQFGRVLSDRNHEMTISLGILVDNVRVLIEDVASIKVNVADLTQELYSMGERFEKRFVAVDTRFDMMEERFVAVDTRFDAIDERFVAVDTRFDAMEERFEKRFVSINERFVAVDKRFDAIDERFVTVDKRFDAMEERFVAVDKRFDAMEERFEKRFVAVDKRFDSMEGTLAQILARLPEKS